MKASISFAADGSDHQARPSDRTLLISFLGDETKSGFSKYDDSSNLIVFKSSINNEDTFGIIDTGSDVTIIDRGILQKIGVQIDEVGFDTQGVGTQFQVNLTGEVTVAFKGQFQVEGRFFSADLRGLSKRLGKEVGVIIGMDVIGNLAMAVDSNTAYIAFSAPDKMRTQDPKAITLDLKGRSVTGQIDGVEGELIFDTGSSFPLSVISERWRKFFGDRPLVNLGSSTDVTGLSAARKGVEKATVRLLGFSFSTLAIKIDQKELSHDAYLGYPVLDVGTIMFNFPQNRIVIVPRSQTD